MKDDIVLPAWEIASKNSGIKVFNFFPSLLSTLYLSAILLYQVAWSYINVFNLKDAFFGMVVNLVHASYFFETLILVGVFFIAYVFITPIAEGGLVAMIDQTNLPEGRTGYGHGVSQGLKYFLPVFEANNITALFKLLTIITFTLFLIRLFGTEYIGYIILAMGTYFVLAIIVNVFLAYTRFFIVIEQKKAFDAIVASAGMALENLGVTVGLYFTLILVYMRTILTVLAFIIFPFVLSTILTYITIAEVQFLFIGVFLILFIGFIVFVSHLNSVLEIFVETLWYRAYMENKAASAQLHAHHESTQAHAHQEGAPTHSEAHH